MALFIGLPHGKYVNQLIENLLKINFSFVFYCHTDIFAVF